MPSFYDTELKLTASERKALRKHTGQDLADEIGLMRILIKRELAETADIEVIAKSVETIIKARLADQRLATKPDDELRLAFMEALNVLDKEDP